MSGIIPRETVSCLNSPFLPHQELVTVIRLWKSSLLYPPDVPWNVVIVIGAVQGRNPAKIDAWFKHLTFVNRNCCETMVVKQHLAC